MAKTLAEQIAVMQAAERGEEIELCSIYAENLQANWKKVEFPMWNWVDFDYRVKPKPQKFWVLFDTNGRVMAADATSRPDYLVKQNPNWNLEWYERTPR